MSSRHFCVQLNYILHYFSKLPLNEQQFQLQIFHFFTFFFYYRLSVNVLQLMFQLVFFASTHCYFKKKKKKIKAFYLLCNLNQVKLSSKQSTFHVH